MAINFDALPKERPEGSGGFKLVPTGFRRMTIIETSVRPGSNGDYIQVVLEDDETKSRIYDFISSSEKPAIQYKLSRLISACKLPLSGSLELADLAKLLNNRKLVVDVKHAKDDYQSTKQGKDVDKAEVDIFSNDIFYTPEEYATLVPEASAPENTAPPETPTY